jgi:hypothetical protein
MEMMKDVIIQMNGSCDTKTMVYGKKKTTKEHITDETFRNDIVMVIHFRLLNVYRLMNLIP